MTERPAGTLTVHHLGQSQSERIVWLCEELELPYTLKRYERERLSRMAPAEYKALHPQGTAPVITDGPVVLAESGAVIDYILAKYGEGRLAVAPGRPEFPDYLYWFHFANGTMLPLAMSGLILGMMGATKENVIARLLRTGGLIGFVKAHATVGFVQARSDKSVELVERRLGDTPYLAGDALSAADIMMVFNLTTMRLFAPRDLGPYPNIRAYLARIGERPAYQRAMAKGDPGLMPLLA